MTIPDQLAALSQQAAKLQASDLEPLNSALRARGVIGTASSPASWLNLVFQILPLVFQLATGGLTPALIQTLIQLISQWFTQSSQSSPPSP